MATVTTEGDAKYRKMLKVMQENIEDAVRRWAKLVKSNAKIRTPLETGEQARNINATEPHWRISPVETLCIAEIGVNNNVPYAKYNEMDQYINLPGGGVKKPRGPSKKVRVSLSAGYIKSLKRKNPRSKRSMRWKRVYMTKPTATIPWLRPALDETRAEGPKLVAQAIRKSWR